MAKVSLRNVAITPADSAAVSARDDVFVSLEIADHELVTIAGPAPASTRLLLRMIAGLEPVTRGEIYIGDRCVDDVEAKDRDVAMVFGSGALYPTMTVAQNIGFGLKLRKFAPAEITKRVRDAAGIFAIDGLIERMPDELSAVERQRVAIARAVARQPKVFLFDEPFAELESTARAQLRGEVARLHQRLEATMIFAISDSVDALALGGRLVIIDDGAVQQDGSPAALYAQPANLSVARFLGQPPMNLIRGTVKHERDAIVFREAGAGTIELRFARSDAASPEEFAGNEAILGVRPEHMRPVPLTKGKESGPASFRALVDLVENTGAKTMFHLDTGAHAVICSARSEGDGETGRRMQFEVEIAHARLFEAVSGRRIV